ncbi:hypothetical protein [Streptomyces sp. NPDC058398]|uniref:hypothetical protein n=1 Tax=Streptomyces sp. NPDC058398 TaxID=3346479 RepID=UPI0036544F40
MTLAPLTRQDIQSAAEQRGMDGSVFADQVIGRGLEALAEQPVTLIPLLEAQARGEELPETVAEAYEQACRTLCTETWAEGYVRRQERPAVDNLLEVARWAAAALHFSRSAALAEGEQTQAGELHLDLLAGPGVPGLAPLLPCRRHELLNLTESGLFTPVGQRRWVFAHRSYQEHLAAEFLQTRIAPHARNALLWAGSGSGHHILPDHQEVAARLAVQDPDLFDDLLAHDPWVLLLADLPAMPAPHRRRAVEALLETTRREGLDRLDFSLLKRLDHPDLAEQLEPFLACAAVPDLTYLALAVAAMCRPASLTPALLSLAQDTQVSARLRSFALSSVAEESEKNQETLAQLRHLASDPNPSVAEAALEHLWPQHLQLTEYLDLLPTQRSWTYRPRLESLMDLVTADQIDDALDWAIKALETRSPKALVATLLLARCVRLIAQSKTENLASGEERAGRALAALAAYPELSHTVESRTAFEYLRDALSAAPFLRRRLAAYLLTHSSQDHVLDLSFTPEAGVFPEEDLLHWATQWPHLPQAARRAAQPLISRRQRPDDEQLRHAVEAAVQSDPELQQATAWWDAPLPDWQLRRQKHEEERRRSNTFDKDQFTAALEAARAAEPATVRNAWLTVLAHLYRTADGRRAEQDSILEAVAAAPSCPPDGSVQHDELSAAALHVLITAPVWEAHDLAAWGTAWQEVPELTAALYVPVRDLENAVPDSDVDRWAGWALALATMSVPARDQSAHLSLFEQCVSHADPAFETALKTCLDRLDPHKITELVRFLQMLDETSTLDLVRNWAAQPYRSSQSWAAVTVTLTHLGDSAALSQVKDVVAAGPTRHELARERWIAAVHTLMSFADLPQSWPYVRRAFDEPDVCRDVIDRVAADPGRAHTWPAGVAALNEADLADLYVRLCGREELHRPRPEHEPGVAYRITSEENLHDLADALPQLIADRGTQQAADHLNRLATSTLRYPARLRRLARHTARQAARQHSEPLPAHQLRKLAVDHSLRVISDEAQLLNVVMEALDRVQESLSGPNGMAILLWNRAAAGGGSPMWPMWEEDFSDLVMGLLKIHLAGRRIILNREVQVDRPGAGGGRTDIHVQAADPAHDAEPFTVVIECKGCWNRELPTALTEQLVDRYLRRPRTAGIFLIGFFDCDLWDPQQRPRCSPGHTRQQIEHEQQQLARQQHATVHARVLDCRPPGAQID